MGHYFVWQHMKRCDRSVMDILRLTGWASNTSSLGAGPSVLLRCCLGAEVCAGGTQPAQVLSHAGAQG